VSPWRARAATLAVVVATALVFALAAPRLRFTTEITAFLPDDGSRKAQLAAMLADSDLSRLMILDVAAAPGGASAPRDLALALMTELRARPDVASVRSGFTEEDIERMRGFLAAWPPTTFVPRDAYSEAGIHARLGTLREQLASPVSAMMREGAPRDPFGGQWESLDVLRAAKGGDALDDDGGVVVTADRAHAFLFVETKASPFASSAQRAFREVLDAWLARTPGARLQTAGSAQFAIASEAQIKADINRIGTISTIGALVLFLALFGSVRLLVLAFIPVVFGSAVAVLACQALYGEVHGITLAFGTSLLGVGLDYIEHYYTHLALAAGERPWAVMRRVTPSIALGAVTTIIGFAGLAASGLPGLRQMAVFSAIAIVASLVATCVLVPPWMPAAYRPPSTIGRVERWMERTLVQLTRRPWTWRGRGVVIVLASVATVVGLRGATFSDDVNVLLDASGPHVAEDRAVRDRLGGETSTFAVVTGTDDETLLAAIGRAAGELARTRGSLIDTFVPLDRLVPSRDEQLARHAAAVAAAPRIRQIMDELELAPDAFQPFWDALAAPPAPLLALSDVRRSPLAPLVGAWLPASATPVALIPIVGARDLRALGATVPSATIVAPAQTVVDLFRAIRFRTISAALVGFGVIFALLLARYRSARIAVIALGPALLACVATIVVLAATGAAIGILHVMALLLVASLGVDFGIFLADANAAAAEVARSLVSIVTASISTVLSFGLLALSHSPGLAALGLTVTVGVTASVVFSFLMAAMSGRGYIAEVRA
jgi:predicted exporter